MHPDNITGVQIMLGIIIAREVIAIDLKKKKKLET